MLCTENISIDMLLNACKSTNEELRLSKTVSVT